jgi:hypothetical protein
MKRYKKDLKSLNCLKIKVENSKNKFSLNIENCCSCKNNNNPSNKNDPNSSGIMLTNTKFQHHFHHHTCASSAGKSLSRSFSENCMKNIFKKPTTANRPNLIDSTSTNPTVNRNESFFVKKAYQLPAKHLYEYEIHPNNTKTSPRKETSTSKYNFHERINPLPMKEENFRRFNLRLPDTRRSIDRLNSQESTTASTSTSHNTNTTTSSAESKPVPVFQPKTERRFYTLKSSNAQNLLKEPVKLQRKTSSQKQATYNDNDSYLDSVRNMSSNELNNYIEKLITQFRIKSRINNPVLSKKTEKISIYPPKVEQLESSRKNANSKNQYRDDLFVVSEMSNRNSNASEDTYIKKILNEEEDSLSVEDLNLGESDEDSNDLINYTHSYELEELSSQNTSFNQEESSQSANK